MFAWDNGVYVFELRYHGEEEQLFRTGVNGNGIWKYEYSLMSNRVMWKETTIQFSPDRKGWKPVWRKIREVFVRIDLDGIDQHIEYTGREEANR